MKSSDVKMLIGLEIEAEYNNTLIKREPSEYHSMSQNPLNNDWFMEEDSSLSCHGYFNGCAEFISHPFLFEELNSKLNSLKSSSNTEHLIKCFNFNNSTGCHIHMTLLKKSKGKIYRARVRGKRIQINDVVPISIDRYLDQPTTEKINRAILKKVKEKFPSWYDEFNKNFYRDYAMSFNIRNPREPLDIESNIYEDRNYYRVKYGNIESHSSSWNVAPEGIGHLEFRSMHLRGLSTWKEVKQVLDVVIRTIKTELLKVINNRQTDILIIRPRPKPRAITRIDFNIDPLAFNLVDIRKVKTIYYDGLRMTPEERNEYIQLENDVIRPQYTTSTNIDEDIPLIRRTRRRPSVENPNWSDVILPITEGTTR